MMHMTMMNDPPTVEEIFFNEMTDDQRLAATVVVLKALRQNSQEGGSFRNFLYSILHLDHDAYFPTWEVGGQDITNALDGEIWSPSDSLKPIPSKEDRNSLL